MRIVMIVLAAAALAACTKSGEAKMHQAGAEATLAAKDAASAAKSATGAASIKAGDALKQAGAVAKSGAANSDKHPKS
jgi:hypothetical protein